MKTVLNDAQQKAYIAQYELAKLFSKWGQYETTLIRFDKGEMICDDEKGLDKILFLVKGCLKIYYISIDGKTHALTYISPFAMLGDMEFVGAANGPYAVAVTEVECIAIALDKYQAVLAEARNFCTHLRKCLGVQVTRTYH